MFVLIIIIAVFKNESINMVIFGEKRKEYSWVGEIVREDAKKGKEMVKEKGEMLVYCITRILSDI